MIDLSYKPKKEDPEKELPLIFQFFLLLPFGVLFAAVLLASFINGIY